MHVGTLVAGRYRVERVIARGGMGVVYCAMQEPLGRPVALKLIRGDALDEVARGRFLREAQLVSALTDPRIVTVHDFGETDDGTLFLVMELLHGRTLRERLRNGPLQWSELAPIAREVAAALATAHAARIVHRDLKPDNVLLVDTPDGTHVKVLDFGLAKETDRLLAGSPTLTRTGGLVGTPGYIAPEAIHGAPESPRLDVYALGVLLWECLVGRHPFAAETPLKTIVRASQEEVPPLQEVTRMVQGAPGGIAEVLKLFCAREPEARAADGAAALAALRELADASTAAPVLTPLPTMSFDGTLPSGAVFKSVDTSLPAPAAATSASTVTPEPARWRVLGAAIPLAFAAAVIAAVLTAGAFIARESNTPRPADPSRSLLAGAQAALASGNAVAARVQVAHAMERADSPWARALWSAAEDEARLLDVPLTGRATGVVFVGDDEVAVSNRNRAIERYDLRTGAVSKAREFGEELIDVDAGKGGLASCDLDGNVRWRRSDGELTVQLAARECRAVAVGEHAVWAVARSSALYRWAPPQLDVIEIGLGSIALAALDDARAVLVTPNEIAIIHAGPEGLSSRRHVMPEPPAAVAVAGPDEAFVGGAHGGVYRIRLGGDGELREELVRRHGARAEALAISRDGLLASAGADEHVRLGLVDGRPATALVSGPRAPIALAFSPSGRRLAVLARDRLSVFEVARVVGDGAPTARHEGAVEALAVRGDDLWSGGVDGRVLRWSLTQGRAAPLFDLAGRIEDLDIAGNADTLAVALADGRVVLLDAVGGRVLAGWMHGGGATGVRFSPDGRFVVSVGRDGRVLRTSLAQGVPQVLYEAAGSAPRGLFSVAVGAGDAVAVGGAAGHALLITGRTTAALPLLNGGCGSVFSVALRANGDVLLPCNDGKLVLNDARTHVSTVIAQSQDLRIYDVDDGGERIAVAGHRGVVMVQGARVTSLPSPKAVNRVRLLEDVVAMAADDGTVRIVSTTRPARASAFDVDLSWVRTLAGAEALAEVGAAATSDGLSCALHADGVTVWSATGRAAPTAVVAGASALAASPMRCAVLQPGGVRLLDERGAEAARVELRVDAIGADGDGFVAATPAQLLAIAPDGARTQALEVPEGALVTALAAHPARVVIGRDDGSLSVLSRTGAASLALSGAPVTPIRSAAVAPDGGTIAAGTEGGDVLVWDADGVLLDATRLHGPVAWLRIDDTGVHAATLLGDGATRHRYRATQRCELLQEVRARTGGIAPRGGACAP